MKGIKSFRKYFSGQFSFFSTPVWALEWLVVLNAWGCCWETAVWVEPGRTHMTHLSPVVLSRRMRPTSVSLSGCVCQCLCLSGLWYIFIILVPVFPAHAARILLQVSVNCCCKTKVLLVGASYVNFTRAGR